MFEDNPVARFCFVLFEAILREGAEQMTVRTKFSVSYGPSQYVESIVDVGGIK